MDMLRYGDVSFPFARKCATADQGHTLKRLASRTIPVSLHTEPNDRRAYLAKANRTLLKFGGMTLMLVLFSVLQEAEAQRTNLVDISSLEGVSLARQLSDSSVQITLQKGTQFTLPENAVPITADGQILVSSGTAEQIASFSTKAGVNIAVVGAGALGGIGLAAGGGGGSSEETTTPIKVCGRAIDSYLANADVFMISKTTGF